ncbi:MAG TPA: hypothetical protein VFA18_15600 [Gemmataceae bacterium]|nr:hypothetical protein [Gemmataceae bacterium]
MGKKPLVGMVGFFGLSLALAGCSGSNCLTCENGPPWKNNLARNSQKDPGWKDAAKGEDNSPSVASTDLSKYKSPTADAGKELLSDPPTTAYRTPGASGTQPLNGSYPMNEPSMGSNSPVVNSSSMRLPDDGLKGPAISSHPAPMVREYTPQAKAPPSALEEPSLPPTHSLPTIKSASNETVVPPPPPPVSVDPSLSAPPPPLPVGMATPGSNLPEVPTAAPAAPPALDPVPPSPAPLPPVPPVPPPPAPPPG